MLLNAALSDTNIFGSGLQGQVSVDKSDRELSGQISLTNPRIFDSEYSLGGTLYANDYDWRTYKERSYGFSTTLGRKLTRNLSASLTYNIEQSKVTLKDDKLRDINTRTKKEIYREGKAIKAL